MKLMKRKSLLGILAVSLVCIALPAHAGNDTSWIPTDVNYSEPTVHSFAFTDKLPLPEALSYLTAYSSPNSVVCKSTSDPVCASSNNFSYSSILKVCNAPTDTDCISRVSAFDSNGNESAATFEKYTVENHINAYPADPVAGIPQGSMPSIWSMPSAPHASGNDYAVFAGIKGSVDRAGNESSSGSFMQLALIPVVLKDFGKGHQSISAGWSQSIPGIYYDYCATSQEVGKPTYPDCSHVNGSACLFSTVQQGLCYAEEPFGAIQKFNVQLRLSKEPSGWMHGRMVDPSISITKTSGGGINLSVTAEASAVPMVYQTGTWASLPSNIQDLWVKCNNDDACNSAYWLARSPGAISGYNQLDRSLAGNAQVNMIRYLNAFGPLSLEIMSNIAPLIGNKSQAMSTTWSMRTLTQTEMNGANRCFSNSPGLKGIVTTNSTTYSQGPPAFVNGSLSYKVSSPHYEPDGTTPFKGNYNLVMRSDVARCLYGFSKAPISATISVTGADGASEVATTVVGESNGWLHLSANNFEFSAPTVSVKLTQVASAKSASSAKPTIKNDLPAPKTLKCRNLATHKITALPYAKAGCPKKYKAA